MRNYAQEGWVTQLQGRVVVGHYMVSTKFDNASAALARMLSIRNPAVPSATRQRHMHIVRAYINASCNLNDDAEWGANGSFSTVTGYTVTDSAGGTAIAPVNLGRSGIDSLAAGMVDTAGGLSGGTLGVIEQAFVQASISQSGATGTDAHKSSDALWTPTWGPILITGDMGIVAQAANGPSTPGIVEYYLELEWLESEKQ